MTSFELIRKAEKLFKFKEENKENCEFYCMGLLAPSCYLKDNKQYYTVFHYNNPALAIEIQVSKMENSFECFACISSTDDSGCSIHGKKTTLEKAMATAKKLKRFFEKDGMICPTKDEIIVTTRELGLHPDWW